MIRFVFFLIDLGRLFSEFIKLLKRLIILEPIWVSINIIFKMNSITHLVQLTQTHTSVFVDIVHIQYIPFLLGYTEAYKFPEHYILVFHCAHKCNVFGVRCSNQLMYQKFDYKQILSFIGDIPFAMFANVFWMCELYVNVCVWYWCLQFTPSTHPAELVQHACMRAADYLTRVPLTSSPLLRLFQLMHWMLISFSPRVLPPHCRGKPHHLVFFETGRFLSIVTANTTALLIVQ